MANSDAASEAWDARTNEVQHLRDFYLLVTVRRDRIIQDAFDQLWQRRKSELVKPLRVRLGEMEFHEVGQDLGGVQIEFFNLICTAIFAEDNGRMTVSSRALLAPLTLNQVCSLQTQSQASPPSVPAAYSLCTCSSCSA